MIDNNIKEVTLEEFINENSKLLSALGFFVALVALSKNSSNWVLNLVSFFVIGGMILLWYELFFKMPAKISFRLSLFRFILLWGGISFIIYWIYEFRAAWNLLLWVPAALGLFAFYLWNILPIIQKFSFINKYFGIGLGAKSKLQRTIYNCLMGIIIIVSLISGVSLSLSINIIFDSISNQFGH